MAKPLLSADEFLEGLTKSKANQGKATPAPALFGLPRVRKSDSPNNKKAVVSNTK